MRPLLKHLRSKDIEAVMRYLLDYQVSSYEKLTGEQKVFLWCAAHLNDELRMRQPRRNAKLYGLLRRASSPLPFLERKKSSLTKPAAGGSK